MLYRGKHNVSAFSLTEWEKQLLRGDPSSYTSTIRSCYYKAHAKEKLLAEIEADKKHRGETSLATARGAVRMKGTK